MSDINDHTKSWKQQAELTTDDANKIARLLGAVDLKSKKDQQPGTFEPLDEDESVDETLPHNFQQQKQPQNNDGEHDEYDKYEFIVSGTWLARKRSGHQAMSNPQDDVEGESYDASHTTTAQHSRPGTAPKSQVCCKARCIP